MGTEKGWERDTHDRLRHRYRHCNTDIDIRMYTCVIMQYSMDHRSAHTCCVWLGILLAKDFFGGEKSKTK